MVKGEEVWVYGGGFLIEQCGNLLALLNEMISLAAFLWFSLLCFETCFCPKNSYFSSSKQ